jgi:hypothetical protein
VIKTAVRLGVLGLVASYLMGCASAMSPVSGAWYTDVKGPLGVTDAYGGTAMGESCASSILGLIATGDASIDAAKKNGGVAQVTAVDHKSSSLLGITAKFCTIVYGKKGASGGAKM